MKNKTLEPKTDTQTSLSPYQAERAEAQQTPVLRPDPLGGTLARPGREATVRAHAAGQNRATAGRAVHQLQRQYGNRYVQRVVELAQRRGSGEGFTLDDETAGRINRARGGGQPLDGTVQAQMSEALGRDFSGVRVHTGSEADLLNHQLSATAFTTGQDIFFRRGEYNPGSGNGRKLIAHELTHVVQQGTGRVPGGGSSCGMAVSPAGDAFEIEAQAQVRECQGGKYGASDRHPLQSAAARPGSAGPADILALRRTEAKCGEPGREEYGAPSRGGGLVTVMPGWADHSWRYTREDRGPIQRLLYTCGKGDASIEAATQVRGWVDHGRRQTKDPVTYYAKSPDTDTVPLHSGGYKSCVGLLMWRSADRSGLIAHFWAKAGGGAREQLYSFAEDLSEIITEYGVTPEVILVWEGSAGDKFGRIGLLRRNPYAWDLGRHEEITLLGSTLYTGKKALGQVQDVSKGAKEQTAPTHGTAWHTRLSI